MEKITKKYILNNSNQVRSLVCEQMCFVNHADLRDSVSEHICRSCPFMNYLNVFNMDIIDYPLSCSNDEIIDADSYFLTGSDFCRF